MTKKIIPVAIFLLLLISASTIPFLYESSSIFYKFGLEKHLLRTAKIIGIAGALFLMLQPVLSGRFKLLTGLYTNKNLMGFHKRSGYLILAIALIHPLLVLWSNDFVLFPLEREYLPEYLGIILTIFLIPFISVSLHKKRFGLNYKTWKWLHFTGSQIIFVLLFFHVFFVSTTFGSYLPF